MAKPRRDDFWGRTGTIWGGETLTCKKVRRKASLRLGIEANDQFRIEKGPGRRLTLVPNPANKGPWKDSHSKSKPVKINPKKIVPTSFKQAYSMMVTRRKKEKPEQLFLVVKDDGGLAISSKALHPVGRGHRSDHDMAGVER
jgi:hypothetical protein